MKTSKLFSENKREIENVYKQLRTKYDNLSEQKRALSTILNQTYDLHYRLSMSTLQEITRHLTRINKELDETYSAIRDLMDIYNYYAYKEERGRRRKG